MTRPQLPSAESEAPTAPLRAVGWHEGLALPDWGVDQAFAKLDTGADSSCLHAPLLQLSRDESSVQFRAPLLRNQTSCIAFPNGGVRVLRCDVVDLRLIRSSNGSEERRPVIETAVILAQIRWTIRVSLTNRSAMRFPALLGRDALRGRFVVDAARCHTTGAGYCPAEKPRAFSGQHDLA